MNARPTSAHRPTVSVRRSRSIAALGALTLAAVGVAGPAQAQEPLPDSVNVPGSYGPLLGCVAAFDIDCPTLTYVPATGDFRGTFDLPAGDSQYYAFVNTGRTGAGYGPTGTWTGEFYRLDHPGGPVTFVYDPTTRLVTVAGDGQPDEPVPPQFSAQAILTADNGAQGATTFGLDVPTGAQVFAGDWDGDGIDTLAWRERNLFTFTGANRDGGGEWLHMWYGLPTDEAFVGDWDGDGIDTIGVRRGNQFHLTNGFDGRAAEIFWYGKSTDDVVAGDVDGDGDDTVSVRRGNAFHLNNALNGGDADLVIHYGTAGDSFLLGDINGDGTDSVVIRRGSQYHLKYTLATGNADEVVSLGDPADAAVLGDWDGDGVDTLGVVRR